MSNTIHPLHATEAELAQSFGQLRAATTHATREEAGVALAWNLRQRDSRRARTLIQPVLQLATKTITTLRAHLIEAEIACLFDEQQHADAALASAEKLVVQLNPDATLQGDTLLCVAVIQALRGDLDNALATFARCIDLYKSGDDPLREHIATGYLCYFESTRDPTVSLSRIAKLKLQVPEYAQEPALAAYIYASEGVANFWRNPALSVALLIKTTIAAGQAGMRRLAIASDLNAGWILHSLGDLEASSKCVERALSEANESGWPGTICNAQTRLGALFRDLGDLEKSRMALESAVSISANSQSSLATGIALSTLGHTLLLDRKLPMALENYERAISIFRQSQSFDNLIEALIDYARTLSAAMKPEAALQAIREAGFVIEMYGFNERVVALNEALAEIYTAHSMPAPPDAVTKSADAHFLQAALDHGQTLADWQPKASLLKKLAASYAKLGEHAKAYMYALRALNAELSATTKQAASRSAAMQIREEVEHARTESRRQRELAQVAENSVVLLNKLSAMGQEITANLSVEAIAATLATQLATLNVATHLNLWLRETARAKYTLQFSRSLISTTPTAETNLAPTDAHIARLTAETIIDSANGDCLFCAPLMIQKKPLALIEITAAAPLAPASIGIFRSLNTCVAIALENAHTYKALANAKDHIERLSQIDSLTGLHNRQYVKAHIGRLLATIRRDACLGIFLVDIDHFKAINDAYGHSEGDTVLEQIPARLQQVFNDDAILVRWDAGGFLVLQKNVARDSCAHFAKRLNQAFSATPFGLKDGAPISKTCSIGYTCYPPDAAYPESFDWQQALNFADLALKHAKKIGRNRTIGLPAIDSRQAGNKSFQLPWQEV